VKIAIIDSGVHPHHPHVGGVAGGVGIVTEDYLDRLGHGTAVAAAIREKVPDAELYAVKIFDRRLSTNIDAILQGLRWCVEQRMDVINLSLGIPNPTHRDAVMEIPGLPVIVAPENLMAAAIGVAPDSDCPRDVYFYRDGVFYASPFPRPIPGVAVDRNLQGASFAVANMTGFVARTLKDTPRDALRATLIGRAANNP
jgi:subtilisin family serine protease